MATVFASWPAAMAFAPVPVPVEQPIPISGTAYTQDHIIALTEDVWSVDKLTQ
jgi:hypothetical protein